MAGFRNMDYALLNDYVERVFIAHNNQPMKTSTIRRNVERLGLPDVKTKHIWYLLNQSIYNPSYCKTEVVGCRPQYQLEPLLFNRISPRLG